MTPRKLNLLIARFSYSGNGGISCVHPSIVDWSVKTNMAAKAHPSIDKVFACDLSDTPITMTRNRAVRTAKTIGADILMMVDSDQFPDLYLGKEPWAKPFFDTSLEFLLARYDKGPVFIMAPYCGPPPDECVYVFRWANDESGQPEANGHLEMWPRYDAAIMSGIGQCDAGPTGLIMFDTRIFDLKEPPYFYYEYKDRWHAEKASTEDVVATRDLSFACTQKLGYNPAFCNWDAWAGHMKSKCVGKPLRITADQVASRYAEARSAPCIGSRMVDVGSDGKDGMICGGAVPDEILRRQEEVARMQIRETPRKIGDRTVANLGHVTPDEDLEALQRIVRKVSTRFGGRELEIVELGSWVGESAVAILQAAPGAHLTCVDTFAGSPHDWTSQIRRDVAEGKIYDLFLRNTQGLNIDVMKLPTTEAAKLWSLSRKIDLLWIDAGHEEHEVAADIDAWLPYVNETGFVVGHDYCDAFPGVKAAARRKFGNSVINFGSVWVVDLAVCTSLIPVGASEGNGHAAASSQDD